MRKHNYNYCVYIHSINGVVFYVGSGNFNRPYKKGRKDRNELWFQIAESNNYNYQIDVVFESDDKELCLMVETELTKYYKYKGEAVANKNIGKIPCRQTREKLSNYAKNRTGKNNPFYGKHHSQKTIDKIRKGNIGNTYSAEINAKKAHFGEDNPSSHSCVVVFDNGEIKEYRMIKELIDDIGCINASAYARGVLGTPKHYWVKGRCYIYYKEDYFKIK